MTPEEILYPLHTHCPEELEMIWNEASVIKAMTEYARQEAIGFAEWTLGPDCEYSATDENQWTHTETRENITTAELYDGPYMDYLAKQNKQSPNL